MKRITLFLLLIFSASFVFAQKADSSSAKQVKTKNIDGTLMTSANDLFTNLSASPQFSTVAKLLTAAGMADSLKSMTITFFAPTGKAFDKLPAGTIDTLLLPNHKTDLISLLNNHMVSRKLTSKDINKLIKAGNGQATLTMVSGGTLTARINENRNIVLSNESGDQAVVTRLDIEHGNGMLFVINGVLSPKPKQ
jgi:uncharacterized surface protein with fasciclin (FAS1) repeats